MRVLQSLESNLKKMDIIGPPYSFENEGENYFKSVPGGIISFLILVFTGVAAFIFGLDLIDKKNPYIGTSLVQQRVSYISLYKFPIIFSIYTKNLSNVANFDEYVSFQIDQIIGPFTIDSGTYSNPDKFPLKKCNITEEYDFYKNAAFPGIVVYCPDFPLNTTLQNEFLSSNSTSYTFNFFKCDPSKKKCADDLEDVFDTLMLYVAFIDSSLDPQNYLNPVESIEIARGFQLSNTLQKTIRIGINNNNIMSDIGWIFKDLAVQDYIKINSFDVEYSLIRENSNSYITQFIINCPTVITSIQRNYIKVQEIFAKVGGVINALFLCTQILFRDFLRFKYLQFIRRRLEDNSSPSLEKHGTSTYNLIKISNLKPNNEQTLNNIPIIKDDFKDPNKATVHNKESSINPAIDSVTTVPKKEILDCLNRYDFNNLSLIDNDGYIKFVLTRLSSAFGSLGKSKPNKRMVMSKKLMSLSTYIHSLYDLYSKRILE